MIKNELGEINRMVKSNSDWFDEGIDMINLAMIAKHSQQHTDFLLNFYTQDALNASKYVYVFSQQGYALLCKFLKSDLARHIYKQMVRDYFRMKEMLEKNTVTSQSPEQTIGDQFDVSSKRFITALEVAKLAGITNEHEARQRANQITKQTTGFDLLKFVRPGYVPASKSSQQMETEGALVRFVNVWWEKYGEEAIDSHYLRQMIINSNIPLELGSGTMKSQKSRLSRILARVKDRQIGDYCITEAGMYRNSKLWKLQPVEK